MNTGSNDIYFIVNPLPNDEIFDLTKLKTFADDKLNVATFNLSSANVFNLVRSMISLLDRVEKTVGKGKHVDYQHFLLSHSVFQSLLF